VFVLFCLFWDNNSTVDSSFTEAMVYQKSWKLEDGSGTGKTWKSLDDVWIPYWQVVNVRQLYLCGKMYHCLSLSSTRLELNEFFGIRTEE
jgi:hypothetical protein